MRCPFSGGILPYYIINNFVIMARMHASLSGLCCTDSQTPQTLQSGLKYICPSGLKTQNRVNRVMVNLLSYNTKSTSILRKNAF